MASSSSSSTSSSASSSTCSSPSSATSSPGTSRETVVLGSEWFASEVDFSVCDFDQGVKQRLLDRLSELLGLDQQTVSHQLALVQKSLLEDYYEVQLLPLSEFYRIMSMDLHPNYSISAFESREKYENWKRVRLETTKNLMKTIVISGALNMSEMYNSAHAVDTSIRLHILSLSSTDALLQHVQTRQQDETSGNSTSSNAVLSQIVIKLSYHSFCSEDLVVVDSEAALSSPLVTNKYVELGLPCCPNECLLEIRFEFSRDGEATVQPLVYSTSLDVTDFNFDPDTTGVERTIQLASTSGGSGFLNLTFKSFLISPLSHYFKSNLVDEKDRKLSFAMTNNETFRIIVEAIVKDAASKPNALKKLKSRFSRFQELDPKSPKLISIASVLYLLEDGFEPFEKWILKQAGHRLVLSDTQKSLIELCCQLESFNRLIFSEINAPVSREQRTNTVMIFLLLANFSFISVSSIRAENHFITIQQDALIDCIVHELSITLEAILVLFPSWIHDDLILKTTKNLLETIEFDVSKLEDALSLGLKSRLLYGLNGEETFFTIENLSLQPDHKKIDDEIAKILAETDVSFLGEVCNFVVKEVSEYADQISQISLGRCDLWKIAVPAIFPFLKPVVQSTFYSDNPIEGRIAFDLYFSLRQFHEAFFSRFSDPALEKKHSLPLEQFCYSFLVKYLKDLHDTVPSTVVTMCSSDDLEPISDRILYSKSASELFKKCRQDYQFIQSLGLHEPVFLEQYAEVIRRLVIEYTNYLLGSRIFSESKKSPEDHQTVDCIVTKEICVTLNNFEHCRDQISDLMKEIQDGLVASKMTRDLDPKKVAKIDCVIETFGKYLVECNEQVSNQLQLFFEAIQEETQKQLFQLLRIVIRKATNPKRIAQSMDVLFEYLQVHMETTSYNLESTLFEKMLKELWKQLIKMLQAMVLGEDQDLARSIPSQDLVDRVRATFEELREFFSTSDSQGLGGNILDQLALPLTSLFQLFDQSTRQLIELYRHDKLADDKYITSHDLQRILVLRSFEDDVDAREFFEASSSSPASSSSSSSSSSGNSPSKGKLPRDRNASCSVM